MTVQQAFEIALQRHRAGRLAEAEAIYLQVLAAEPAHAPALHLLGVIAQQTARLDRAVDLIQRALVIRPDYPEARNNLGNALKSKGLMSEAISAYQQAIALRSKFAEAHYNLASLFKEQGQLDEAIAAFRQALAHKPDYPEAQTNLGIALREKGSIDEAIAAHRRAVELNPRLAQAWSNLGNALKDDGQRDEAITAYRQAVALQPGMPEAHCNLAAALKDKGQLEEAIVAYRQALALKPDLAGAYAPLGLLLRQKRRLDEAIAVFQQVTALKPDDAEALSNLGGALVEKGRLDEALVVLRRALALRPDCAEAHNNLGGVLFETGQLAESIAAFRAAVQCALDDAMTHSNVLYALLFDPGCNAKSLLEEHRQWNARHAAPLRPFIQPHANSADPDRRLRIGYLSPNFSSHVVGRNVLPIVERHNSEQFEVYLYSDTTAPDAITDRFRQAAHSWREIYAHSDQAVAELIRADGIDILVDLCLHMAENRLPVFARKPAPVQVTWAGYPGTTGLDAIDYRITDPYLDPEGAPHACYSEASVRLPHSFWCFDPRTEEPAVNPLPALFKGYLTFGSLNTLRKINEGVIDRWSAILRSLKDSRLLLLSQPGEHRQRIREQFEKHGVDGDRIAWFAPADRAQYLAAYHQIDLGLDPFPYNGHSTSIDSFWMGVPVITLVGKTVVGRAGLCQAMNLGLPELIAATPEEYVKLALELAGDLPRLSEMRERLRARMKASPLMDAGQFTRDLEVAYRGMWRRWSDGVIQ